MKSTARVNKRNKRRGNRKRARTKRCPQCGCALTSPSVDYNLMAYCTVCGCVPSAAIERNLVGDQKNDSDGTLQVAEKIASGMKATHPEGDVRIDKSWLEHARPLDQTERNITIALGEITTITLALSLDLKIAERAAQLCRAVFEIPIRGQKLNTIAAASVYAAAKLYSTGVTLNEVAYRSKIKNTELSHCFKTLHRQLHLSIPLPSIEQHVVRILGLLGMKGSDIESMANIMHNKILKVQNIGALQGRNPGAVAGALVYLIATEMGHDITQREIAAAIGITETTIRNCCALIRSEFHTK